MTEQQKSCDQPKIEWIGTVQLKSSELERKMIYAVSKSVIKVSSVSIKSILILFILLQSALDVLDR